MSAFEELGLCPEIIQAIEEDDWLLPTPVQQEAVPLILTGGDVLAAAETGSGKTGAFGLPSLQIVHEILRGRCKTRDADDGSSKKCELNLTDKDSFVRVTEDGLECKSDDDKKWYGVRATTEVLKGGYMFEVEVVKGLIRVGWSSSNTKLDLGCEEMSYGYGSTGKKSTARKFDDWGESFKEGDVIGCLLDCEQRTVSFCKNGKNLGEAFKLPEDMQGAGLKPHICGKGFAAAVKFDGPLEYPVEGYTPVGDIDPDDMGRGIVRSAKKRPPMCMILEPTRDLADQTYKCMVKFSKYLEDPKVKIALFVGGGDEKEQLRALEDGIDICVGTLQKTMDLVRREKLDVTQIKFLVLDEADDLQKKDERKDIPGLNAQIKRGRRDRVQTLFFSATLHTKEVVSLIEEITDKPTWVDLKGKDAVPDTVHQVAYYIDPTAEFDWTDEEIATNAVHPGEKPGSDGIHDKPTMSEFDKNQPRALRMSEKVKQMKPKMLVKIADLFKMSQCLVFVRTNVDANLLEGYFNRLGGSKGHRGKFESGKENPYSCVVLAASRNQSERQRNLEAFKDGDVRFLICTDVAARGIDIAGLPFVIQMTLPDDIENYIHRIGRCGRAERLGLAISLVATEREKVWYHKCPSRGKNCLPKPGNTKLTIPFGLDNQVKPADEKRWWIDEGGCTVWFDEPDLMDQVEKRIGQPVKVMDPQDFHVTGILESPLPDGHPKKKKKDPASTEPSEPASRRAQKRRIDDEKKAIVYGARKGGGSTAAASKHIAAIAPTVSQLTNLEKQIQQIFARAMWGNITLEGDDAKMNVDRGAAPLLAKVAGSSASISGATAPAPASVAGGGDKPKKKKVRW